jgi:glycosyltransferase involved in cell wall biosynthesis
MHPDALEFEVDEGVRVHRVIPDNPEAEFLDWVAGLNRAMIRRGEKILDKDRQVILHAHDWLVNQAGKSLKNSYKIPLLATIHATEQGRYGGGTHGDTQRLIAHQEWELSFEAWRVICCSYFMKDEIARALNCPKNKLDVIPNGVIAELFDESRPDPEFRARFAAPNEKIVFFVGRMVHEKGAHLIVGAAPKVLAEHPNTKFVIAGGGNRDHLVDLVRYLGLEDNFRFTGYVDDETLHGIYQIADVAVFPSLYEPFGIVALEAMAAGVPVVVSDAGGLREVVDSGVTGVVVPAGNPLGLAYGILQVLQNPGATSMLVENASRKVRQVFNWDRIADQTLGVYHRVWKEYQASDWSK